MNAANIHRPLLTSGEMTKRILIRPGNLRIVRKRILIMRLTSLTAGWTMRPAGSVHKLIYDCIYLLKMQIFCISLGGGEFCRA